MVPSLGFRRGAVARGCGLRPEWAPASPPHPSQSSQPLASGLLAVAVLPLCVMSLRSIAGGSGSLSSPLMVSLPPAPPGTPARLSHCPRGPLAPRKGTAGLAFRLGPVLPTSPTARGYPPGPLSAPLAPHSRAFEWRSAHCGVRLRRGLCVGRLRSLGSLGSLMPSPSPAIPTVPSRVGRGVASSG